MPATATQRSRVRRDLGDNSTPPTFDDVEIDDAFDRAAEEYSDPFVIYAYARVILLDTLIASSAKLVNYRQNQSEEDQSDIAKALERLRKTYAAALNDAIDKSSSGVGVRWGGLAGGKPHRRRSLPGA
jgi:hypothetical protein